jgi:hypothetical protein
MPPCTPPNQTNHLLDSSMLGSAAVVERNVIAELVDTAVLVECALIRVGEQTSLLTAVVFVAAVLSILRHLGNLATGKHLGYLTTGLGTNLRNTA